MKKINRKYFEAYSDQIFYYLTSDHHAKHYYIIRFFKGAIWLKVIPSLSYPLNLKKI